MKNGPEDEEEGVAPGDRRYGASEAQTPEARTAAIEYSIDPSGVLRALAVIIAVLVTLSVGGQAMVSFLRDFPLRDTIARLLSVDGEQNIPTLFSTVMLIVAALLFAIIGHVHGRAGRGYARHWTVLSLVFALLAIDEFTSLHEESGERMRELLDIQGGPLWFAWVLPAGAIVAVFAIAFIPFLRHLPRATRRGLWLAATLYVGGAIGAEMVGSSYASGHGNQPDMAYALITAVEEGLEMLGIAVLVYVLLAYIPVGVPNADRRVRVVDAGERRPRAVRGAHEVPSSRNNA